MILSPYNHTTFIGRTATDYKGALNKPGVLIIAVATNKYKKNEESGKWEIVEETEFIPVLYSANFASIVNVPKGMPVLVSCQVEMVKLPDYAKKVPSLKMAEFKLLPRTNFQKKNEKNETN